MTPRRKKLKKEKKTLPEMSSMQAEESQLKDIELSITKETMNQLQGDLRPSDGRLEAFRANKDNATDKDSWF